MITLLYNFITRLAASVMIYLPAGSVSEQNMLPLIFFFGCFFWSLVIVLSFGVGVFLSLFCHLGLSSCCNLLSHVCQCFFGHMLGDIYSWMLDGYFSICFPIFGRFLKFSPEMLNYFHFAAFSIGRMMIYHWIWGLILVIFHQFFGSCPVDR